MIHKTRGIVFHAIKYSETSIITKIYTEKFGLQSYIVRGARKPKARLKASLFQPLSLLELEVYYKQKSTLQNIKEARSAHIFTSIPFDVRKSSIVLFLSDVLTKAIKEEETNRELFHYLDSMIRQFDIQKEYFADLFVESKLIIELKACKALAPEHTAQLLGYLRACHVEHGLLVHPVK